MSHSPLTPVGKLRLIVGPRVTCMTRAGVKSLRMATGQDEAGEDGEADERPNGKKREQVGFSARSKLSLARLLSTLDWDKNGTCCHCSLTYHERFPKTKKALALEKSYLTKELAALGCGIWKLEFQERGAPHWHVLLWIGLKIPALEFEEKLRAWWAEFSGNGSWYGVKVTVGDEARAAWYLALHSAKDEQAPKIEVGRWWGYVRRKDVLAAQEIGDLGEVSESEALWLGRFARRFRRVSGRGRRVVQGFTLFLTATAASRLLSWLRTASGLPEVQEARERAKDERCTVMAIPANGGPQWERRKVRAWSSEDF